MSEAPNYTVSKRVQRVWKKFSDWYGAAVIAREFGAVPPREWCDLIDGIKSQRELDRILIEVRRHHVVAPPRFPAFAKIVENVVVAPARRNGPTLQEQLTEYLVRTKPLSRRQLINKEPLRWDYRYVDGRINA